MPFSGEIATLTVVIEHFGLYKSPPPGLSVPTPPPLKPLRPPCTTYPGLCGAALISVLQDPGCLAPIASGLA